MHVFCIVLLSIINIVYFSIHAIFSYSDYSMVTMVRVRLINIQQKDDQRILDAKVRNFLNLLQFLLPVKNTEN